MKDQWVIWCNLNAEQDALEKAFGDECVSIYGSLSPDEKERRLMQWLNKEKRIMVSKVSIFGMGLNLQQCHKMAFVGLSDSYEQFYQAARRCWRFGQKNPVDIHVITAETEGAVVRNIQRKEDDAMRMAENMLHHMKTIEIENIKPIEKADSEYSAIQEMVIPGWLS